MSAAALFSYESTSFSFQEEICSLICQNLMTILQPSSPFFAKSTPCCPGLLSWIFWYI